MPISLSDGRATVPCKWCKKPTTYLGTRECDPCHNAAMALKYTNPEVLANMLVVLGKVEELEAKITELKGERDGREG